MKQLIQVSGLSFALVALSQSVHGDSGQGTFSAWGSDIFGQSSIPAGRGFRAIVGGNAHSVGLYDDGTVACWGQNAFGQASAPGDLRNVVQVAAGGWYNLDDPRAHSAALLADGTVRTWGNNQYGQCNVPAGLNHVVQVVCGWAHTAALKDDHSVVVWGAGDNNSGDPNWGQRAVPNDLGAVDFISTKGCHIMALRTDGVVRCWGRNAEGQSTVPSMPAVVQIAAGSDHSVALDVDGHVRCWGFNHFGQSSDVPTDTLFSRVEATMYGSMGLARDGRVLVWGWIAPPPQRSGCIEGVSGGGYHAFAQLGADADGDGLCDASDNCPAVQNPDQADCDHDGSGDACEIANGYASDFNHNGIPDNCECLGDILLDGRIDGADLGAVLSYWGPATSTPTSRACDVDNNGVVNGADLGLLLSNWGPCSN